MHGEGDFRTPRAVDLGPRRDRERDELHRSARSPRRPPSTRGRPRRWRRRPVVLRRRDQQPGATCRRRRGCRPRPGSARGRPRARRPPAAGARRRTEREQHRGHDRDRPVAVDAVSRHRCGRRFRLRPRQRTTHDDQTRATEDERPDRQRPVRGSTLGLGAFAGSAAGPAATVPRRSRARGDARSSRAASTRTRSRTGARGAATDPDTSRRLAPMCSLPAPCPLPRTSSTVRRAAVAEAGPLGRRRAGRGRAPVFDARHGGPDGHNVTGATIYSALVRVTPRSAARTLSTRCAGTGS